MFVYKRSLWVMIKGLIMAPFAGVVAVIILGFFVTNPLILYGVPVLASLVLVYMALFSENIRFELDRDGQLRYFKRGRLLHQFALAECAAGYHRRSEGGFPPTHDITLQMIRLSDGEETAIDCSPIGLRRFEELYTEIKAHTGGEPEVMRATQAE